MKNKWKRSDGWRSFDDIGFNRHLSGSGSLASDQVVNPQDAYGQRWPG